MRFFNQISLSTPESVELEFTLAGIGNRTLALVIDYHVLALLLVAFWIVWGLFSFGLLSYLQDLGVDYSAAPLWLLAIAILLNFIIYTGYFVFFEVMWQGQTPGKRFARIRVVCDDGRPVRLSQVALRALLRPIDDFLFIGVFFILFGKREKRIGDWVAGTIVVQEERGDRKVKLVISERAQQLAPQLPYMTNFTQLLPDDFAVVREYLKRREIMAPQAKTELSLKLAEQLRNLIALETIPQGLTSDQFLEAVYLAYQQQQSPDQS
jgi:uncharacterized RDD family membrane protein YckC